MTGPKFHQIDAVDAFKLAVQQSGLTVTEIATRLGWTQAFMRRVFSTDKFFPSFPDLPAFCSVVGNRIILQWLECNATSAPVLEHSAVTASTLPSRITGVFSEAGDVAREAHRALLDNTLDSAERRRLIAELTDLLDVCLSLVGDLRAQDVADA